MWVAKSCQMSLYNRVQQSKKIVFCVTENTSMNTTDNFLSLDSKLKIYYNCTQNVNNCQCQLNNIISLTKECPRHWSDVTKS